MTWNLEFLTNLALVKFSVRPFEGRCYLRDSWKLIGHCFQERLNSRILKAARANSLEVLGNLCQYWISSIVQGMIRPEKEFETLCIK